MMNNLLIEKAYAASNCKGKIYSIREIFDGINFSEKGIDAIPCFVTQMTTLALDLVVGVAFIMILYSAFLYLTAYGDEAKAETAKKTLIWSIVGVIVVALAYVVVSIVRNSLT